MEVNQKVKEFFVRLSEDEELRDKFEAAAKRQDLNECALLSQENGFNFTEEDLQYMAELGKAYQDGELSEEQMELVSGGSLILLAIVAMMAGGLLLSGGIAFGAGYGAASLNRKSHE